MKRVLLLALLVVLATSSALAQTTVILVRHAERVDEKGDVDLIPAGHTRAKELARVLGAAPIKAIYVTQWKRTSQTVQPLAEALKIAPIPIETSDDYARNVVAKIMKEHRDETVLVAGHSDSTVSVLNALGIDEVKKIEHMQFDDLFICTIAEGKPPRLLALRYGAVAR